MKNVISVLFILSSTFCIAQSNATSNSSATVNNTNSKTEMKRLSSPLIFTQNSDGTKTGIPVSKKEFVKTVVKKSKEKTVIKKTTATGEICKEEILRKEEIKQKQ